MSDRPLKRQRFHILLALVDEDLHGYGIVRAVLDQTQGELRLWPVMLYRSLDEMAADGLITELTDPEERPAESERRRYFRITAGGRAALADEVERIVALGRLARQKLVAARSSST